MCLQLGSKLLQAGARPVWVPAVAINPLVEPDVHALDAALRSILRLEHSFTHVAFTSKNGIYATLTRLAELIHQERRHLDRAGMQVSCLIVYAHWEP